MNTSEERPKKRKRGDPIDTPTGHIVYISENPNSYERPQPVEEDEEVVIDEDLEHVLRIGTSLIPEIREKLINTLQDYKDVFAYSTSDMQGLDPNLASHELNIKEGFCPIKQKLRHQVPERNAKAAAEVKKLLEAGIIEECQYTELLAKVVLVKKATGAWRLCVDFTDLKKACPKDDHPLPKIGRLVDSTVGHELLSFMDANAGYHQIPMAEKDQIHTTFVTAQGVYYYKICPSC